MRSNILVFAYYSFNDPVFQSAVLPYFIGQKLAGRKIILLTWEQNQFQLSKEEIERRSKELALNNIIWCRTRWHSGVFKIVKKGFDFTWGLFLSLKLIYRYKIGTIYSEGFPGAIIGHYLARITGSKHIIHTFEPHADYMYDAGVWKKDSWEYRLLKAMEVPVGNRASTIITATEAYAAVLRDKGVQSDILVAPSCIDLDFYSFNSTDRNSIRKGLGITDTTIVIAYLGKIGGMYMDDEIFRFWRDCLQHNESRFRFFLLSNATTEQVKGYCHHYSIPFDKMFHKFLSKEEVPAYLSAADFGFCGIRPIPSRRYSSPIKNGEYWACGLPTIIPAGMSDDAELVRQASAGFVFFNYSELAVLPACLENAFLDKERYNGMRKSSIELAQKHRDLSQAKGKIGDLINNV
jgi:hypothetical protein